MTIAVVYYKLTLTNNVPERDRAVSTKRYVNKKGGISDKVIFLGPIILFAAVTIVVLRLHVYQIPGIFFWDKPHLLATDIYNYAKLCTVIVCVVWALFNMIVAFATGTFVIKKLPGVYLSMGVLAAGILLSCFFSEYKYYALWAYGDSFEGTIAWVCYLIMLFYTINFINTKTDAKIVLYAIAATTAFICVLGLFQVLGANYLASPFTISLIAPKDIPGAISSSGQVRSATQTVYNANYVSLYTSMLIPLFGILLLGLKTMGQKLVMLGYFGLLCFNFFGSGSSGGYIGLFVAVVVSVVMLNKRIFAWKKWIAAMLAVGAVSAAVNLPVIIDELKLGLSYAANLVTETVLASQMQQAPPYALQSQKIKINYIETTSESVIVSIPEGTLEVKLDPDYVKGGDILCLDENGSPLPYIITASDTNNDSAYYYLADPRFDGKLFLEAFIIDDKPAVMIHTPEKSWTFIRFLQEDQVYYINDIHKTVSLTGPTPVIGFQNSQHFGTNRGYIWSRTLPMFKDTLLIGHGAGTFPIYFPQNDYVGKYNVGITQTIDKPHNMYLNMGVSFGLISLMAFLYLMGYYIFTGIKQFATLSQGDEFIKFAGAGIVIGITSYLCSALINDSNLSTTPMFLGLLGVGIALNYLFVERV